ncbi:MAG: sulfur oxidation c-type cytochrome SoxA [Candidatus Puniceispirillum sp.]|nr:sulfur oxidation c-type cytochrome SoxA [Candidatus Puniceispirillum sp.]MBL6774581.1 sulfur oxidation c-type cytochrome SoxA [Candidatus Puniceispirillum sp.]
MRLAISIVMALGLLATGVNAKTPYHDGTAEVIKPKDKDHPLGEVVSGYDFRKAMIRDVQDDDFSNPAMLVADYGEEQWTKVEGTAGKSMSDVFQGCAEVPLNAVGAVYPRYHSAGGKVMTLEQVINMCRETAMGAKPYKWESREMLGLTAFIKLQSRGSRMEVAIDGPASKTFARGEELYYTRFGQLDMSCAHCHEDNYGNYIRADMLSQGQTNGFPLYRLKWNGVGSVHRRFRGCLENIRAQKPPYGHEDLVALELYTAWRGNGLKVETPAYRN